MQQAQIDRVRKQRKLTRRNELYLADFRWGGHYVDSMPPKVSHKHVFFRERQAAAELLDRLSPRI